MEKKKIKQSSNEKLCSNVKYYRITRGFTQEKISEKMNMSEKHYCHLENGKYQWTMENLDLVADILEKEPWELLKEDHSKDPVPSRLDLYKKTIKS